MLLVTADQTILYDWYWVFFNLKDGILYEELMIFLCSNCGKKFFQKDFKLVLMKICYYLSLRSFKNGNEFLATTAK